MPVFRLEEELLFPPPSYSEQDGLLAVGGDLSAERLLLAYSSGIFPWFNEDDPTLWWSPDPRYVIDPSSIKVSRSLEKTIRSGRFNLSIDRAFDDVVEGCAEARRNGVEGTWITEEMKGAYRRLFDLGHAHSIEAWHGGELAGGLYGVSLGRCFFGESMFFRVSDASKVAFVSLARLLESYQFELIDCQLPTEHLKSFGAYGVKREIFLERLVSGGVVPSPNQLRAVFPSL
ncbi:MAG: leucyl/phenylalanyl-tRNA--protein transferase [Proteobacteria bacterium]|nr:leucyl/phenylalanyl-tRNA--protein transferase [Pseudomonadota bacterium]